MFTRARWFAYGTAATLGATVLVVTRARSMRERLDAEGVARVGASFAADAVEYAGRKLQRSAIKATPDMPVESGPTVVSTHPRLTNLA